MKYRKEQVVITITLKLLVGFFSPRRNSYGNIDDCHGALLIKLRQKAPRNVYIN